MCLPYDAVCLRAVGTDILTARDNFRRIAFGEARALDIVVDISLQIVGFLGNVYTKRWVPLGDKFREDLVS